MGRPLAFLLFIISMITSAHGACPDFSGLYQSMNQDAVLPTSQPEKPLLPILANEQIRLQQASCEEIIIEHNENYYPLIPKWRGRKLYFDGTKMKGEVSADWKGVGYFPPYHREKARIVQLKNGDLKIKITTGYIQLGLGFFLIPFIETSEQHETYFRLTKISN